MESTLVTYPSGATSARARVQLRQDLPDYNTPGLPENNAVGIATDTTCFHPLDSAWPDQPADQGELAGIRVIDCLTGAIDAEGKLFVGADIPVRRGADGWSWVVLHVVAAGRAPDVGDQVDLAVDQVARAELSAAHTACHLVALALNEACRPLWRKDPGRSDSLGSPDLDGLTIERSRISPMQSVDTYRLGKSIRKKGLNSADLLEQLPEISEQVQTKVRGWIRAAADVHIDTSEGDSLVARRRWRCELPEGLAEYPCGGTHVRNLIELPIAPTVTYEPTDSGFEGTVNLRESAPGRKFG
jgi:alanyl-tRNA synthetase